MKRKLLVILLLIVLFVGFVLLRFFVFEKNQELGRLKVLSSPTAGVVIDNTPVGKAPYETRIAPGDHTIKLIPEGEDSQTVTWEGTVPVYANTLTYISRELGTSELTSAGEVLTVVAMDKKPGGETGQVSVETDPTGAIVFLDNDEKGVAPLVLEEVPAGEHELAVYLPGFFRRSQKISIEKGYTVKTQFKLALDKTHKTLEDELEKKQASAAAALTPSPGAATTTAAQTVKILDTPTGFLNVRSEPSVSGDKVTEVDPGDTYEYTEEQEDWYKIVLKDGTEGWVYGDYVEVL